MKNILVGKILEHITNRHKKIFKSKENIRMDLNNIQDEKYI